ncbi:MAG: tripartite tricarboxylate transporter substrate-binding protein, partial [Candidatus Cloacimonadota bacterium]|nr:tripartite tricarboxylate transporter substrate-binding protein [Candidatus Cloacimonadota bacterium]
FVDVASKYTNATFVVENKPGSGGIVALKRLLQLPSDGYTMFACTKSNISKIVSSGGEAYIDGIDWVAMMMADPECVITHKKQDVNSWNDIVKDAKQKNGKQLWLGPANGGLDHTTAMKIWDEAGIKSKWIPFKSGGKARAALLGEQGVAYVGNPREILGNDELQIAAISREERLSQFPDVPTFKELGLNNLDNEIMWRGFVLKKGTPPDIRQWYDDLFTNVNDDPEWREYWERGGVDVVYKGAEEFTKIVEDDKEQFTYYLSKIGIINKEATTFFSKLASGRTLNIFILSLLIIFIVIGLIIKSSSKKIFLGRILIPLFFIFLSIIFFVISFSFPSNTEVGPSVVPRLWILVLIPLNLILLFDIFRKNKKIESEDDNVSVVFLFIGLLILYLLSIFYLGYFISSFAFIFIGIYLLGYRRYGIMTIIATGWLLFSYLIFYRLLFVPLPMGKLLNLIF